MKLLIEQIDDLLLEARIDDHIAQLPSGYEDELYQLGDLEPKYMDWAFIQIRRRLKKAKNEQEAAEIMNGVVGDLSMDMLLFSIKEFDKLVKHKVLKGKDTDIFRYSEDDLFQLIVDQSKTIRKIDLKKKHKDRLKDIPREIVVYEDSNYVVYKVLTMAAACSLPHGDWCISTKSIDNKFDDYKKVYDNIYFIHHKKGKSDSSNNAAILVRKSQKGHFVELVDNRNNPFFIEFDNNGNEIPIIDERYNLSADYIEFRLGMSIIPVLEILKLEGIIDSSASEHDYL